MKTTPILLLLCAFVAMAVQPNFVRTTVFNVDGSNSNNIVSTSYSDGLGRQIQSKAKISETEDRTACTFYDEAGRPDSSTKAFIDQGAYAGSYLPGDLGTLNAAGGPLRVRYPADLNPFSYSKYSDDPLSRVIEQNGPGAAYADYPVKTFYFGMEKGTGTPYMVPGTSIEITDGLITSTITDGVLYALSSFGPNDPDHFLTVTRTMVLDYRAATPHPVFTQELKDIFGKTAATKAKASSSQDIISKYYYDILGNLQTETPPGGTTLISESKYTYNTLGQLVKKVTPDGGIFGFTYTLTGKVACDTSYDAAGTIYRIRRYSYDEFDRQTTTEVKINPNDINGDAWNIVTQNYYDAFGELSPRYLSLYNIPQWLPSNLHNTDGQLVASIAISTINGTTYFVSDIFSYDDEGRIEKKFKIVPGLPLQTISYTYDLHGKVLIETTECGSEHIVKQYNYDTEGRLINVVHVNNENKVLASYDYDKLSRLEKKNLAIGGGLGHDITYGYNIREWITSLASPSGIKGFTENQIGYYPNGNIASAHYFYNHQGAPPNTSMIHLNYLYDDVNRLTDVIPGVDHAVSIPSNATLFYDVIGRIKYKEEGTDIKPGYRYYSGTSRLRNTRDDNDLQEYYYDKNGNMVIDVNKKMVAEYDWRDMSVVFRFYNALPGTLPWDNSKGTFTGDPKTYVESNGSTLVSQVVMLYDASGNRVLKMEGK